MEHYKSTLATTAFAVFGLVAAAHHLHPGNYEMQPRPARPVAPLTWVDPPTRMATAGPRGIAGASASDLLAPRMVAELPPGAVTAPALPSAMVAPAERSRKTLAAHRPKAADRAGHRVARLRRATLTQTAAADPAAAAPVAAAPAQTATKIDPIGDLIRGLGLGRDG